MIGDANLVLYRDEVLLRILYTTELKTSHEIAHDLSTTHRTILNWLNRYGVPIRDQHESHNEFVLVYRDAKWLTVQYVNNKKSTSLIAKETEMSQTCIFKWLKLFNIPLRSKSEAHKPKKPRAPKKIRVGHPHSELSRAKIAKAHIGRPLSEDHKRRVSAGRRGKLEGCENPNWRGGLSLAITARNSIIHSKKKSEIISAVSVIFAKNRKMTMVENLMFITWTITKGRVAVKSGI